MDFKILIPTSSIEKMSISDTIWKQLYSSAVRGKKLTLRRIFCTQNQQVSGMYSVHLKLSDSEIWTSSTRRSWRGKIDKKLTFLLIKDNLFLCLLGTLLLLSMIFAVYNLTEFEWSKRSSHSLLPTNDHFVLAAFEPTLHWISNTIFCQGGGGWRGQTKLYKVGPEFNPCFVI